MTHFVARIEDSPATMLVTPRSQRGTGSAAPPCRPPSEGDVGRKPATCVHRRCARQKEKNVQTNELDALDALMDALAIDTAVEATLDSLTPARREELLKALLKRAYQESEPELDGLPEPISAQQFGERAAEDLTGLTVEAAWATGLSFVARFGRTLLTYGACGAGSLALCDLPGHLSLATFEATCDAKGRRFNDLNGYEFVGMLGENTLWFHRTGHPARGVRVGDGHIDIVEWR